MWHIFITESKALGCRVFWLNSIYFLKWNLEHSVLCNMRGRNNWLLDISGCRRARKTELSASENPLRASFSFYLAPSIQASADRFMMQVDRWRRWADRYRNSRQEKTKGRFFPKLTARSGAHSRDIGRLRTWRNDGTGHPLIQAPLQTPPPPPPLLLLRPSVDKIVWETSLPIHITRDITHLLLEK